jgi:UDP-sugar transporter A1/2/3
LSSTAVVLSELLKCIICLYVHIREQRAQSLSLQLPTLSDDAAAATSSIQPGYGLRQLWTDLFSFKSGFLKLLVPGVLYTLQNNLQFVAASNLDAATFQVTYQCKILTTALFAVLMLGQSLSAKKWLALVILTAGVACVQIPSGTAQVTAQEGNYTLGIAAVAVACVCSGFAGVYFERVLKGGHSASIWVRNIQLSVGCLGIALSGALVWDGQAIYQQGFFQGYNPVVVATVCIQAAGGLIVAMVIKYADNILKGFATSLSIILSTLASVFLFNFVPTIYFVLGSILVFLATYLYSMPESAKAIEGIAVAEDEKSSMLNAEDRESGGGLAILPVRKPFKDESDLESGDDDGSSHDGTSIYDHDDGRKSRNFSPSLLTFPTLEKQVVTELGHVG